MEENTDDVDDNDSGILECNNFWIFKSEEALVSLETNELDCRIRWFYVVFTTVAVWYPLRTDRGKKTQRNLSEKQMVEVCKAWNELKLLTGQDRFE